MPNTLRELVSLPRFKHPGVEPANVILERSPEEGPERITIDLARQAFRDQAAALEKMARRVDVSFCKAIDVLSAATGRIVFIGLGKSGLVCQKLAATFSSTGSPSVFVHAGEAHHGDLGMISRGDVAILVSYSGETREVVSLLPYFRDLTVPVVALAGRSDSTLGRSADVLLDVSVASETCPNNLAPTTSSLATMAMGDALAVALARQREFAVRDFSRLHPGGSLGRKTRPVRDAMRTSNLPLVCATASVGDSLVTMDDGRLGLLLVVTGDQRLVGLVTDGDLRRAMQRHRNLMALPVSAIMTLNPATIRESELVSVAEQRMQQMKLKALVALDHRGRVSGVIDLFG